MKKWNVLLLVLLSIALHSCTEKDDVNPLNSGNNPPPTDTTRPIPADSLRLNQIQVIGSHNSYRIRTTDAIFNFLQSVKPLLTASGLNPDELDYTHLPLPEQFSDYGIRQIELDIFYDPDGGRFYNRGGNQLVQLPVESGIPELNEPGFKVLHIPDVDYETHYFTFKQALQAVKDWSETHPRHIPIFILIETKETGLPVSIPFLNVAEVLPFDVNAMNAIDEEIREVFGAELEKVITPDDVRDTFPTLRDAITKRGWPTLAESRGKVIFLLNNGGTVKDNYLQGHPGLQGRILFVNSGTDQPESAFIMQNNPHDTRIELWVTQGFIVRTRADDGTYEARTGDTSKRDRALASGAQLISTDYYRPDPRYLTDTAWTDYQVSFAGYAPARLNPVSGPKNFDGGPLE
ncbi:MAG: hypothetical protein KatS3mg031_1946 [Chitinophagales bacterium]|nr:MAG: hypothetical protein KatS3mg031_1946 [Chitinophagales bacterium]